MKYNYACILLAASLLPLSPFRLIANDATTSGSDQPAMSPAQAAQREAVSRQQSIFSANQAVEDGKRFLDSGKFDDAAVAFLKALRQRPSEPDVRRFRAEALIKAGKPEAAESPF